MILKYLISDNSKNKKKKKIINIKILSASFVKINGALYKIYYKKRRSMFVVITFIQIVTSVTNHTINYILMTALYVELQS